MIRGVGTDIVAIERIAEILKTHDDSFVRRVLTPDEQQFYEESSNKTAYLAKRFAAKEAISKALGCGIGAQLGFQDIEISSLPSGAPDVSLTRQPFRNLRVLLSLSDEKEYAVAFAVIEE